MHPVLFNVGSFQLYSYGLMMALAVLSGLYVVDAEAKRLGLDRDLATKMVVYTFLMGLLGARVLYIGTRITDPSVSLIDLLANFRAGFVYYGGYGASWLFLVLFLRHHRKKLPFWSMNDAASMAICIGLAIGRIGCLLGGCCFGRACDYPWGVIMQNDAILGRLHPVQIYEFIFLVILFAFFWWRRHRKSYEGEITVLFAAIYAIGRYVLEFYRGDSIRGFIVEPWLSTSQFIGLLFLPLAIWLHLKLRHTRRT